MQPSLRRKALVSQIRVCQFTFRDRRKESFVQGLLGFSESLKISYMESGMFPNRQMLRLIKSANSEANQSGPLIRTSKGF